MSFLCPPPKKTEESLLFQFKSSFSLSSSTPQNRDDARDTTEVVMLCCAIKAITLVHWAITLEYVANTLVHFRIQTTNGLLEGEWEIQLLIVRVQECGLKKFIYEFLIKEK